MIKLNKEEAWKKFQESGKVEDYLKYKEVENSDIQSKEKESDSL